MTSRRPLITLALSLLLGALAALVTPGCGEDGITPTCPELTLYDIGAGGERNAEAVAKQRAEAVAAGCMTDLADASTQTP